MTSPSAEASRRQHPGANLTPGRYPVGPANGQIVLCASRTGVARSAGHDLVLELAAWSCTVAAAADRAASTAEVTIDLGPSPWSRAPAA